MIEPQPAHRFRGAARSRRTLPALLIAGALVACATATAAAPAAPAGLAAALDHGLRPAAFKPGEAAPGWSLRQRMAHHHVPGVAIAWLRDGRVVHAAGYGVRSAGSRDAVDADTLFSVGSISKMVTAATSLRLVAAGRIALDRDVNGYLKSWRITPRPGIDAPVVTLRMLLSHTSGLGVHGFKDYQPDEALPSLLDTLDGRPPAKNAPVRLEHRPGARMDYSGGGTMVEQLLLETVADAPLEAIARQQVFMPLGMTRSTFASPLPDTRGNIAHAHDEHGVAAALPRGWQSFPEQAASGLWTSANELGAFVGALLRSYRGGHPFLPRAIAIDMMTAVAPAKHGLGPVLDGVGTARVFQHGGANDSYRAWIEGYPETGDGFVILTNGRNGGALLLEIRNALSDAIGLGVDPPIRAIAIAPGSVRLADYAGRYHADAALPIDLRRDLVDYFDTDVLEIELGADGLRMTSGDDAFALLPLAPAHFAADAGFDPPQLQFHRDAHGSVRGISVTRGAALAYYRREPTLPSTQNGNRP